MSVNYNVPTITDRLAAVVSHIDAGSSNGKLRLIAASTSQTVALITLQKPSGIPVGNVLFFSGLPLTGTTLTTTSSNNPVAFADIEDSSGTVIVSGLTVGLSTASDIVMSTTSVLGGNLVSLIAATITGV